MICQSMDVTCEIASHCDTGDRIWLSFMGLDFQATVRLKRKLKRGMVRLYLTDQIDQTGQAATGQTQPNGD